MYFKAFLFCATFAAFAFANPGVISDGPEYYVLLSNQTQTSAAEYDAVLDSYRDHWENKTWEKDAFTRQYYHFLRAYTRHTRRPEKPVKGHKVAASNHRSFDYVQRISGTCEDDGHIALGSIDECNAGAKALGVPDVGPTEESNASQPTGCYVMMHPPSISFALWFNTYNSNISASSDYAIICRVDEGPDEPQECTSGIAYKPWGNRSKEDYAASCKRRCLEEGAAYFNFFDDGGCHCSDASAETEVESAIEKSGLVACSGWQNEVPTYIEIGPGLCMLGSSNSNCQCDGSWNETSLQECQSKCDAQSGCTGIAWHTSNICKIYTKQITTPTSNENYMCYKKTQDWNSWKVRVDRTNCYQPGQNGVIRSLAVHPIDSSIAFAGGPEHGIFKTNDTGLTWSDRSLPDNPFVGFVNQIVISRANPKMVYAATAVGIFASDNGGDAFNSTAIDYSVGFPDHINYAGDGYRSNWMFVDVHPLDGSTVVATDINPYNLSTVIRVSMDRGSSWSDGVNLGKFSPNDLMYHPTNGNIIYVLLNNNPFEFYRSLDGGVSFSLSQNFPHLSYPGHEQRARLAVTPAQPDLVLLYVNVHFKEENGIGGAAFFTSTDQGQSFSKTCCGPDDPLVNNRSDDPRFFFGETNGAVQQRWATAIAISDTDPNLVLAATNRYPRISTDQMKTWYWTSDGINHPSPLQDLNNVVGDQTPCPLNADHIGTFMHGDIQSIVIRGDYMWVANDGGIAVSSDKGITFKERADGLPINPALGFDMTSGNRDIALIAEDHNGVIVYDEGNYDGKWKPLRGGDSCHASVNPVDDFWVYIDGHRMNRPNVGKSHGMPGNDPQPQPNFGCGYYGQFQNVQYHPNNYYTLYGVRYGGTVPAIMRSTDNGASWEILREIIGGQGWAGLYTRADVRISNSNPNVIYTFEQTRNGVSMNRTGDGGNTWVSLQPTGGHDWIHSMEIDTHDPNRVWLATYKEILQTRDGGQTWAALGQSFVEYRIFSMIHQKGGRGVLYVGTQYGVYYINDNLQKWQRYGGGLPGLRIQYLKINYAKGIIRAATMAGIWENELAFVEKPVAIASASTMVGFVQQPFNVTFASLSTARQEAKTSYQWTFAGGDPNSSSEERPVVTYFHAGSGAANYSVALTVTDADLGSATQVLTDFINIKLPPCPTADFSQKNMPGIQSSFVLGKEIDSGFIFDWLDDAYRKMVLTNCAGAIQKSGYVAKDDTTWLDPTTWTEYNLYELSNFQACPNCQSTETSNEEASHTARCFVPTCKLIVSLIMLRTTLVLC